MVDPSVHIPFYQRLIKNASTREALLIRWRRRRDSNPRYVINVYSLSRGAPSATRPLLRVLSLIPFDTSLWTLPGSALLDAMRLALRVALVTRALLRNLRSLGQHSVTSPKFFSMTRKKASSARLSVLAARCARIAQPPALAISGPQKIPCNMRTQ